MKRCRGGEEQEKEEEEDDEEEETWIQMSRSNIRGIARRVRSSVHDAVAGHTVLASAIRIIESVRINVACGELSR